MLKKVYTRLRIDTKYRQSNSDDLYDLGYFTNALRAGTITYEVRISGMGGVKLTDVNGKPTKEIIRTGTFDKHGKSEDVYIGFTCENILEANKSLKAVWTVFLDGFKEWGPRPVKTWFGLSKEGDSVQGHHIPAEWSVAVIAMSDIHSRVRQASGAANEEITKISKGVGWYLVKQEESFGNLMNRICINPSTVDWEIMKENNKHLGNLNMMTLLKPGQVVVVALERNNPKLAQLKKEASESQAVWERLSRTERFNPLFFQTSDLLIDAGGNAAIAKKVGGYDPTVTWLGELTPQASLTNGGLKLWTLDSFLAFNDGALKQTSKSYANAMQSIQATVRGGRSLNSSKLGADAIKKLSAKDISILRSQLGNAFLRAETGLQADSLRNQMKELAQVRNASTQGGIKNYTAHMEMSGKASKALAGGAWLSLGVEVVGAGSNIIDAHADGKEVYRKAVITETLKVGASAAGGWGGGELGFIAGTGLVLLIGATGGGALIIVGLATVVGSGAGQIGGKQGGAWLGEKISDNTQIGEGFTNSLYDTFDPKNAAKVQDEAMRNPYLNEKIGE